MNLERLSGWVEKEVRRHGSRRAFALAIGLTDNGVRRWLQQDVKTLSPKSLSALATYRKESIGKTADWLGMEVPGGCLEALHERVAALEARLDLLTAA